MPSAAATSDNSIVGINYIVWDPTTRELSFRPEDSLEQHTTYALVVTTGVRDSSGNAIGEVESVADIANADYRRAVERAAPIVQRVAALDSRRKIAALSVFTTQTFSHIFERMRDAIAKAPAPSIDFKVGPNGSPAIFDVATLAIMTVNAHVHVQGPLDPTTAAQRDQEPAHRSGFGGAARIRQSAGAGLYGPSLGTSADDPDPHRHASGPATDGRRLQSLAARRGAAAERVAGRGVRSGFPIEQERLQFDGIGVRLAGLRRRSV